MSKNSEISEIIEIYNGLSNDGKIEYYFDLSNNYKNKLKKYVIKKDKKSELARILKEPQTLKENKNHNIKINNSTITMNKDYLGNNNLQLITVKENREGYKMIKTNLNIRNINNSEIKNFIDSFRSNNIFLVNDQYHIFRNNELELEFNDNNIENNGSIFIGTTNCPIRPQLSLDKLNERIEKNNCISELKKVYKGYIDVFGDGNCYYRSVIYSLLTTILFSNYYDNDLKRDFIKILMDIFPKKEYNKMFNFLDSIHRNIDNLSYIDFLEKFTNNDSFIISSVRVLLANNITMLNKDQIITLKFNFNTNNLNEIKKKILTNREYAESSIIETGLLCECLQSSGYNIIECQNNDTLDIKEVRFINNFLPSINLIHIGEHYGILVPEINKNITNIKKPKNVIINNSLRLLNNRANFKIAVDGAVVKLKEANNNNQILSVFGRLPNNVKAELIKQITKSFK
jgi:hypothetical protein